MDPRAETEHVDSGPRSGANQQANQQRPPRRRWKVRQCRICLAEARPRLEEQSRMDILLGLPQKGDYSDEEMGNLICPCKCVGTAKWVHDKCLNQYRYGREEGDAHFLKCYICGYKYRRRIDWANRLRSPLVAFLLAVAIMIFLVFLLGFIANPILSLWLDPVATLTEGMGSLDINPEELAILTELGAKHEWLAHLGKGTLSLGVLGFVKVFLAMSPWQWWNIRAVGGAARRRNTGRDRLETLSVAMIIVGVATCFWAVWKATRAWTKRTLTSASEKILNVQDDSDPDDAPEAFPEMYESGPSHGSQRKNQ